MMRATPDTLSIDGPLSPEQRDQLAQASVRARKILAASRVATFNGWTLAVAGAVSLLLGLFSGTGLIIGIALMLLSWNEFHGRGLLRRFDPRGPERLGKNQLALMVLVIAYCLWTMYDTWAHPSGDLEQLEALLGPTGDLVTRLTVRIYGTIILVSVLVQGLNARYYFARTALMKGYLDQTPAWIIDLQRSVSQAQ
jgi:hypothetical protein